MFDWLVDHFATDSASTHFAVANTNRMRIGYYGIACADPIIRTDLDWLSIELLTAGTEPSREHSVLAMTWDPEYLRLIPSSRSEFAIGSSAVTFPPGAWHHAAAARFVFSVRKLGSARVHWELRGRRQRATRIDTIQFSGFSDPIPLEKKFDPCIQVWGDDSGGAVSMLSAGTTTATRFISRGETFWQAAAEPATEMRELSIADVV